jgi:hypothetical protein
MDEEQLIELYRKEREYQRSCFGEYSDLESLNFASFLNFIETYLKRAKDSYSEAWERKLPGWLRYSKESLVEGTAPVKAYEEIIKVMALAGAALETFTNIDVDEWRKNPEKDGEKWKK